VQHESQRIQQQGRQNNDAEEIGSIANQRSESAGSEDCKNQIPYWKNPGGWSIIYRQYWLTEIKGHRKQRVFPDWSCLAVKWKANKANREKRKKPYRDCDRKQVFKNYWMSEINAHRKTTVFPDWSILGIRYMKNKRCDNKAQYSKHAKKQAIQKKEYRQRPEVKARHTERQRKYCQDPFFRVKKNLRRRLVEVAKSGKTQSTMKYIGCTAGELREHLERQFEKWMNWGNYGTRWHIDHIHPVDSFDHSDQRQISICWHYSNLRPLCALKNVSKGNRITVPQMNLPI
jgi:hypothetical protein